MQGEKEMKGKVSTPTHRLSWKADIWTDKQTDQTDRLQEFHMLYGTKKSMRGYDVMSVSY